MIVTDPKHGSALRQLLLSESDLYLKDANFIDFASTEDKSESNYSKAEPKQLWDNFDQVSNNGSSILYDQTVSSQFQCEVGLRNPSSKTVGMLAVGGAMLHSKDCCVSYVG
jgi:hypothetical protein